MKHSVPSIQGLAAKLLSWYSSGMKKLVLLVVAFVAVIGGIVWLTTWTTSGLLTSHKEASNFCAGYLTTYTVTIKDDTVTPEHIQAARCDRLTIVNRDDKRREIAFGIHDRHVAYDGVLQRLLRKNESLTVDLVQSGDYHFHDHFQDEVEGTFTVGN